jgi:hypothetical protein
MYFVRLFHCKNIFEFKLQQHPTTLVSGCGAVIGGGGGW